MLLFKYMSLVMVYEVSRKPPTHQHTHTHTMSFGSSYETQENLAE